jgi:AbrB family looped-hinge helix DNA binding protein
MLVTRKGQVTIPKAIRDAAGMAPGSEVSVSLDGSRIVITPLASAVPDDRRARLGHAAERVRSSLAQEFGQQGADAIMSFLRPADAPAPRPVSHGARKPR